MKAMRISKQRPIEENPLNHVEVKLVNPAPNQIRIKVLACGVCHTDLHIAEGDIRPSKFPIIPGHQVVGVIDRKGEDVTDLSVGDYVGVPWLYSACGKCEFCKTGNENLCKKARFTGFDFDGGFAEYMIADAKYTLPLPRDMEPGSLAPLLCAGIIGYRSLIKADLNHGENLGLFGFGASAHISIQVARYWNCDVFVFTRSKEHQKHAEELGASWVGKAEDSPPKVLDRAVIFAPVGWMVHKALEKIRPGGTVAINAIYMSPIPEMPYEMIYGERTLRSVANATYSDGEALLKLAKEIPIVTTITEYGLKDANKALIDVKNSNINGEAVLRIE
jgi:propanol-preferring alcohol dehydrogenase